MVGYQYVDKRMKKTQRLDNQFQFSAFIFFVRPKLLAVNLGNIGLLHGLDVPFLGSS